MTNFERYQTALTARYRTALQSATRGGLDEGTTAEECAQATLHSIRRGALDVLSPLPRAVAKQLGLPGTPAAVLAYINNELD